MASQLANATPPRAARAPVRLRIDDIAVLAVVSACGFEASSKLLGVRSPIVQALLVTAWTAAAARRLVAWRYGQRPVPLEGISQGLTVVAGVAPLFIMQLLHGAPREMPPVAPASWPSLLHVAGALFVMASVLAPFFSPHSRIGTETLGVEFGARAAGFILLTPSPLVVALVAGCVMLKGWTGRRRGVDASTHEGRRDSSLDPLPA